MNGSVRRAARRANTRSADVARLPPAMASQSNPPWLGLRRTLGPLGRYRPSLFRQDLTAGFDVCDRRWFPHWRWLPHWASAEEKLLSSLELRGRVVYDVGAFSGAYSLFFSRQVGPAGTVVSFEPEPGAYARLTCNLSRNGVGNVYPLAIALGAENGARPMYMLPGMATTTSLAAEANTAARIYAGRARVEPLDLLLARLTLPAPDFVKVDVEGMEIEVLYGADATIEHHHPDLLIEIHGADRHGKRRRAAEIVRLLGRFDYAITHVESGRRLAPGSDDIASGHLYARAGTSSGSADGEPLRRRP